MGCLALNISGVQKNSLDVAEAAKVERPSLNAFKDSRWDIEWIQHFAVATVLEEDE